MKVVN